MEDGQNLLGGDRMVNKSSFPSEFNLEGKTAVVIGGTGSIGTEISSILFHYGANVVSASKSAVEKKINERHIILQLDATREKSINVLYNKIIDVYKRLDILIMANGIQHREPFLNLSLDNWEKVIENNLTSAFLLCKHLTKSMIENNDGRIIGITSLTSEIGIKNISAYSASKGGMSQFLKSISSELINYNITVNMIAPGRIKTSMTSDLSKKTSIENSIKNRIPLGRFGLPSEISGAVLFLASSYSNYMTGQSIIIDGGWLASGGNIPA